VAPRDARAWTSRIPLADRLRPLSVNALRWWAGCFCGFLGAFMIVAPQEFAGPTYRAINLQPLSWGVAFVLSGFILLAAALRARRRLLLLGHGMAAGVFALLGGGFAGAGGWAGAAVYGVVAIGLLVTSVVPFRSLTAGERRRGDAFCLLFGVAGTLVAVVQLTIPSRVPTIAPLGTTPDAAHLGAVALLVSCPLLVFVQLRPRGPRRLTRFAHLAAGTALMISAVFVTLPVRAWTGVALYGSGGLLVALTPWLRRALRGFDPASLSVRLAFAFAATTSLALLVMVTVLEAGSEREVEAAMASRQQEEALSVARNVVDYLELVGARNESLAAGAARRPWTPNALRQLIEGTADDHPRIASLGVLDVDGTPVAGIGRRNLERLWTLRLGRMLGGLEEGDTVVRVWSDARGEPLLLVASPVMWPDGRPRGMMVTGYDPRAVLWRLSRPGLAVRLVDEDGRVLASQPSDGGRPEPGRGASAPVPGLGWRVMVERNLSAALAGVRRERLLAFGLLLVAVLMAVAVGILAARVIARPLRRLAAAADELATGNPDVPLHAAGISEIDRLSANFRDMRDRLAARTLERERLADELRERADVLADADRRKDEFLAMLGHELRNPLGAISNAAYLLEQTAPADGRTQRSLTVIRRQLRHLTRMVDDLLDVSRITRGKVVLQRSRLDLGEVVRRAVETIHPLFEARSHCVELYLPATPVALTADGTRLEQVVANLLRNAAKYTEPGGHIRVELTLDGEEAVVRVADDGVGMAPELLPRVFDLFAQGHQSLDRAGGGLGIGLTLVRRLVELHGGQVTAASDGPGNGSTFEVRLPAEPSAAGEEELASSGERAV